MILGILSDTHKDPMNAIPYVIKEFRRRNVEAVIHCGDIEPQHLIAELFDSFNVICALLKGQSERKEFCFPPNGWRFTTPDNRILTLPNGEKIYVGHKRSSEFLRNSGDELDKTIAQIRKEHDGLRLLFAGHTHRQTFKQGITTYINPGAITDSFDGYEFAIVDTETKEVTFSRIPRRKLTRKPFSIAVISDSFDISSLNPGFWEELAEELENRNVTHIIHCGNILTKDVGRQELRSFQIYFTLHKDQQMAIPDNWHCVYPDNPIVKINGYSFYVQLNLGADLINLSEADMHQLCLKIRSEHPNISYILCGLTNYAFLEEGLDVRIINPGDVRNDQDFVVITLPRNEICFSHIPFKPLQNI